MIAMDFDCARTDYPCRDNGKVHAWDHGDSFVCQLTFRIMFHLDPYPLVPKQMQRQPRDAAHAQFILVLEPVCL